ncbi:MAG: trigger factor, partial [Clostridia bacterium]
ANELKLEFTVEAEKFENAIKNVYSKNAKYFSVPGFRKGKVPFQMVIKHYGKEVFYEDAFNEVASEEFERELKENKIEAVSRPEIDIKQIESGKDLIFTAVVQIKPEVTLGKYKGITLKKVEYTVSDEDINHELSHMQERNARLISANDRAVKDGDTTVIDFEGFIDGVAFEGGKAENHELVIGSKTFIPGFEDQIIGMKQDEEKDIKVTFPEEYFSKELAGKEATFKVKLHEIKVKELPTLDDDFAKDVSEFDTLEELKNSIKDKLEKENESRAKYETEEEAIKLVCDDTNIDIPSGMIETEVDNMVREVETRLSYQGLGLEQYLQMMGKTMEEFKKDYEEQATKSVKSKLVLEAISKVEKLEVSEEEVLEKVKQMAENYGRKAEELEGNESLKSYLEESIKTEKAIDFIVKNAKIK